MKLNFTKMHGCGNDYIYIDCLAPAAPLSQIAPQPAELAMRLSDRHKSIGGDGVIFICPSDVAHAKMRMFNRDGSEGRMCGNGVRCVAEYLFCHGRANGDAVDIETLSGIKHIVRRAPGLLCVDMGAPELSPAKIPVAGFQKPVINQLVEINGGGVRITCVSMGNPHCVSFVPDTAQLNLPAMGAQFAQKQLFPEGINAEFVTVVDATHLVLRVWERGSGETLACGTGACAAVVAACLCGHCKQNTEVAVALPGGTLTVCFTGKTVRMTGEAVTAFEGTIEQPRFCES
ncbi:MAG: diaminopimelate epimerase [Ruthenibacterium sp.]